MGNVLSSSCQRLKTHSLRESGFLEHTEVSSELLNAKIESVSNECCGEAKNLLKKAETKKDYPIDDEESPDGWLTKRHESIASVTVKFCNPSKVYGFDIDTTGFDNSCPANATVELYRVLDESWQPVVSGTNLTVNTHNLFSLKDEDIYSRIRLTVAPAGGIARLRVYGQIAPDFSDKSQEYNFASAGLGARIVRWTDNNYGNKLNILLDNGMKITDGWLSPRSKLGVPRNDHLIIQLAHSCKINSIYIDTTAFKHNSPTHVYVDACFTKDDDPYYDVSATWKTLIENRCIRNNGITIFKYDVANYTSLQNDVFSHIRLTVIPDGGIQQIRVYGTPASESDKKTVLLIEPAPTINAIESTSAKSNNNPASTPMTNKPSNAAHNTQQAEEQTTAIKMEVDDSRGFILVGQSNSSSDTRTNSNQIVQENQQPSECRPIPLINQQEPTRHQEESTRSSKRRRRDVENNNDASVSEHSSFLRRKRRRNRSQYKHVLKFSSDVREPGEL